MRLVPAWGGGAVDEPEVVLQETACGRGLEPVRVRLDAR
jgi:hypothetical protein